MKNIRRQKLDTTDVLISESLIDSYVSHGEFVSINYMLREYNEIKEEIENPEACVIYYISRKTYERNVIETI